MDYKQIDAGPFCGLFALTLDEYKPWNMQEVIDQITKAEATLNLTPEKRFFIFEGEFPADSSYDKDGLESAALAQVLKARGYRTILRNNGSIYPAHAKECTYVEASIGASGRWINFPCSAIIWNVGDGEYTEPRILPQQDNVPKFIRIPIRYINIVPKILHDSRYPWAIQTYQPERKIEL